MGHRILVVTQDVLLPKMAGPAMRAWHIAETLSHDHEVRLVTTSRHCELSSQHFSVASVGRKGIVGAERWCDVLVLQGYVTLQHAALARSRKVTVFDVYDPLHLEVLAFTKGLADKVRLDQVELAIQALNEQLRRGDFLLCASERQRDLYLGQLAGLGRLNPRTYDDDPTLRRLIDVVPFGLPNDDPRHQRAALRGVVPGIGPDDELVIWAGGVYNWLDPLTVIRAIKALSSRRPTIRLYFMGLHHPNPEIPRMDMARAACELAESLDVKGRYVFFNEGWVDYDDRQNYLLEADVGITSHFASVETRFAFRTRALDYLWAGLPIITTEGDPVADLVQAQQLGLTVPPEDTSSLEEALFRLLSDTELRQRCRANVCAVRNNFRWSRVLEPLTTFCRQPSRAPDLAAGTLPDFIARRARRRARYIIRACRHHYHEGGLGEVKRRVLNKVVRTAHEWGRH